MTEYHKINSIFKREMYSKTKRLIEGEWSNPEFEFLANAPWVFTEKVDGTNVRVMVKDGVVGFGGRTDEAQMPMQLVGRLGERFMQVAQKLNEMFPSGAVLYGEGYGAKIQKAGALYRPDQDFVLFDIRCGQWWLQRRDVEDIAQKIGIDVVPVIGHGSLHAAVDMAKRGIPSTWGDFQAEGIVARPQVELRDRRGERIIAKIKCRDFSPIPGSIQE